MAYDENLALKLKTLLGDLPSLVEKKMFGGVGYLLNGNMACGVHKDFLIVRVGPDAYQEALKQPNTKVFDITGHPMTGWVMVAPEGLADDTALADWIRQGVEFTATLPQK